MNTALLNLIKNGSLTGDPADRLLAANGDINVLRPFIGQDGRSYISHVSQGGRVENQLLENTTATLRKDDWKLMDEAAVKAAAQRLKLVNALRAAGLTFTIPQGMGKTILETETIGEINDATISMDGIREGINDRPEFEPSSLALPMTHKDFQFSARQILASRNGGSPLDTTSAEMSAIRIAESNEKFVLGRLATYTYGGTNIYGLLNFPSRLTRTITTPVGGATVGATLLADVLAMRAQSVAAYHYGPWIMFVAPNWDQYLDVDAKAQSDRTVRERIQAVNGITDIVTLDFMQNYDILMVQLSVDVIRLIIGMEMTTLQWDTLGGMQKNFKLMDIIVPQVRADFNSRTGIVHGSV